MYYGFKAHIKAKCMTTAEKRERKNWEHTVVRLSYMKQYSM